MLKARLSRAVNQCVLCTTYPRCRLWCTEFDLTVLPGIGPHMWKCSGYLWSGRTKLRANLQIQVQSISGFFNNHVWC